MNFEALDPKWRSKMAKKVDSYVKLQVPAGKANPSPPVGPALGQKGVNIMEFCKAFNAQTQELEPGSPVPVVISVYADKSFTFVTKTSPASYLLKKLLVFRVAVALLIRKKSVQLPEHNVKKLLKQKKPT